MRTSYGIAMLVGIISIVLLGILLATYPIIISFYTGNWWFMLLYFTLGFTVPIGLVIAKCIVGIVELFE